jgi:hypothetical protein
MAKMVLGPFAETKGPRLPGRNPAQFKKHPKPKSAALLGYARKRVKNPLRGKFQKRTQERK